MTIEQEHISKAMKRTSEHDALTGIIEQMSFFIKKLITPHCDVPDVIDTTLNMQSMLRLMYPNIVQIKSRYQKTHGKDAFKHDKNSLLKEQLNKDYTMLI